MWSSKKSPRRNPIPDINTLPQDIYDLFNPEKDHTVDEKNLDLFAEGCRDLLRRRLAKPTENDKRVLRFSSLGKPDRQVWFDAHPDGNEEALRPQAYIKFLYGDLLEQLVLFLAREAGHTVEDTQKSVEVDGVTGSIDATIDGVVTDVKSASSHGYKKFKEGTVELDDPFGYVAQLSGYSNELNPNKDAAWVAIDKVAGSICVSTLPAKTIERNKPGDRIEHLKKVIEDENPPGLCYQPVPDGASGNLKLGTACSYCRHKFRCHPGLRTFLYSTGPRYLTKVVKLPQVLEVGGKEFPDG